jgi:stage IV sporulation protein FB
VCRWAGHAADVDESIIAWGGVLAQAGLLAVTETIARTVGFHGPVVGEIATTFVEANVYLMVVNLLPFPPLDGAKAWTLFRWERLRSWSRRRMLNVRASNLQKELSRLKKEEDVPDSEPSEPRFLN